MNVAVTLLAEFMVTTQFPVPLHPSPDHPEKIDPGSAFAVKVA